MPRPLITPICLRRPDVCSLLGVSDSTLQRLVARGDFPPPRRIGGRCVAWLHSEVMSWTAARPVSDNLPPPRAAA